MADTSTSFGKCEMVIGFLVPHRCDHPALGKCVKCGRGFCDEHTNQTRQGRVCLACQQGLDMPVALPIAAAVLLGLFVLQTTTVAQDPGRQLFEDAAAAMGGRDRRPDRVRHL